jgi:hypothetical protein
MSRRPMDSLTIRRRLRARSRRRRRLLLGTLPRPPTPIRTDERVRLAVAHRPAALHASPVRRQRVQLAVALSAASVLLIAVALAPDTRGPPRTCAAIRMQAAEHASVRPELLHGPPAGTPWAELLAFGPMNGERVAFKGKDLRTAPADGAMYCCRSRSAPCCRSS